MTILRRGKLTFGVKSGRSVLNTVNRFKIIAFTHRSTGLDTLGRFVIDEERAPEVLSSVKKNMQAEELCYLSTCNRAEFMFVSSLVLNDAYVHTLLRTLHPSWTEQEIQKTSEQCVRFEGEEALRHLLNVASSVDSMVVGEREILAQVRKSYDLCKTWGLTGDYLRLVMECTVKTAKDIFTRTGIAERPVSVVSLAYRKLRDLNVPLDARFLIIGAGQTNTTMAKYLLKHGFRNFTVFNRTLQNGEMLASSLKGKAFPLTSLKAHTGGFDVLISCTSSAEPLVTNAVYFALLAGETNRKVLIDLAVPGDIDPSVPENFTTTLIGIEALKNIASENLHERRKALAQADIITEENIRTFGLELRERSVELAMQDVPKKIREIRETAVGAVFAKDLEQMDPSSREVLDKVLAYMEKKYISVPMIMAKEILVNH